MKAIVPGYSRGRDDYDEFLKHCALFYQSIEMPSTEMAAERAVRFGQEGIAADIEFSVNVGFCTSMPDDIYRRSQADNEVIRYRDHYMVLDRGDVAVGKAAVFWQGRNSAGDFDSEYDQAMTQVQDKLLPVYDFEYEMALARAAAIEIQSCDDPPDLYMFNNELRLSDRFQKKKARVLRVVFENIALPNRQVPLNEVMDFRRDHDLDLLRLKRWVREAADLEISSAEIADEVQYYLKSFNAAVERNKWHGSTGILEFMIVSAGEFIESAVKLRFKKLAELGFKILNVRQDLLEKEAAFEGAQFAYLHKIRGM